MVPHDFPSFALREPRLDCFREQRDVGISPKEESIETPHGPREEAMDQGYKAGSDGETDSDSADSSQATHMPHTTTPLDTTLVASAGWTSAHWRVRTSAQQEMVRMPPTRSQRKVRGRNHQLHLMGPCSQSYCFLHNGYRFPVLMIQSS